MEEESRKRGMKAGAWAKMTLMGAVAESLGCEYVDVVCSGEEKAGMEKRAKWAGMELEDWMRDRLLGEKGGRLSEVQVADLVKETLKEVGQIKHARALKSGREKWCARCRRIGMQVPECSNWREDGKRCGEAIGKVVSP